MRWWVSRGGQPEGPFEESRVVDMLRSGQLEGGAQVAPEAGGGWQPIGAIPAFGQALAARAQGFGAGPPPPAAMAATMAGPAAPSPFSAPKGVPSGNPMVAGTMAMDSASLIQAMQSSAGLAQAPAYSPAPHGGAPMGAPSAYGAQMGTPAPYGGAGYGSSPGMVPGAQFSAPSHYSAPQAAPPPAKSKLPIIAGCLLVGFFLALCGITGAIVVLSN